MLQAVTPDAPSRCREAVSVAQADREKFPYALQALPTILKERWNAPDFTLYRDEFPEKARVSPEAFEGHVKELTAQDVKVAYLKNLQGTQRFGSSVSIHDAELIDY